MIEYNDLSELSPFLIITPNPAIDRILVVPALQIGQAQRVQESRIAAGGKGLNVGRAMKSLGVTASILAPLGGFTGQQATHLARREGLALSDVPIGDETRVCTLVVDLATQQVTVLNEIGPQLTATEWATFEQAILDHPATWHLFCGSLPPGVEASTLAALMVFSLSFLIIWDNAEAAQYDHLLLWSFLPAVRMPMSIPVSQRCLQGFGQLIQRFETPALKRQGA
jgi:fructose-1-phosphate kinase PfkB-like protein